MKVRALKGIRIEAPRGDGTPGFRDLAPGQEIEIEDGAFDPTLFESDDGPRTIVDGRSSVVQEAEGKQ